MGIQTKREKENSCNLTFHSELMYWHAFTAGINTPLLFKDDSDMSLVMNVIAQASAQNVDVVILAFEVMNNHFHFVLTAKEQDALSFWNSIEKRLGRVFPGVRGMEVSLKPITTLQALRSTIVYTHRNGYVSDLQYHPFNYMWGTGRYYFMDWPEGKAISDLTYDQRRLMFRCRTPEITADWKIINGYVAPWSYCAIRFGMAMFRDSHHYFSMLYKNVEAYGEVAADIDDGEYLSDTELYSQIIQILKDRYRLDNVSDLSGTQRLDTAKLLHYEYRCSNERIRRILAMSRQEIDTLFPLSATSLH